MDSLVGEFTDLAAVAAALIYALAMLLLMVVQTWRHVRVSAGPAARAAGVVFVVALVAGLVAPTLTAVGVLRQLDIPIVVGAFGTVVAAAGLQLGAAAQRVLGLSRIGVDPEEAELVTNGLFGMIRNPILSAFVMIQAGTAAMALNSLSLAGVVLMLLACQLQTRLVEEPYLIARHGRSYLDYASRVGRFVPGFGRLRDF